MEIVRAAIQKRNSVIMRFRWVTPVLLWVAGCSNPGGEPSPYARLDTLAEGRIQVTNLGQERWSAGTPWRFEEDFRLGTAAQDGPEEEQFGRITSLVSDSLGRVFVLDALDQEIRVFDSAGTFLHRIGAEGEGPGEFTSASEINIGPGGDLWVLDDGMSRYTVFDLDGTLKTIFPRRIIGRYSAFKGGVLKDGTYVDWGIEFPDGRFGSRSFFHPVLFPPGSESMDSLPRIEFHWEMMAGGQMPLQYFGGFPVAAVDTKGQIWFAESREYRVFRRSLEGDTSLVFTLPGTARPVTEKDRQFVANQPFRSTTRLNEALESLPETKPILYRIVPDNSGHLFVFVDLEGEPEGSVVDVFQESGEFMGRMHLPLPVVLSSRGSPIAYADSEHLYVVITDDLDVPYVSRLRILKEE